MRATIPLLQPLEQGECKHSPCPSCNEPLTTRTVLAPDVQLILRRRWCPDELVDFHLVIQTSDTTGWRDVARFLGRALELHLRQMSWNPRRETTKVFGLIDQREQVEESYRIATKLA